MSIQSAGDFLTKVAEDEDFRIGLGGCRTRAEYEQFAMGAGFEFTRDEVRAAEGELQDSDLDVISGGGCCNTSCCRAQGDDAIN